MDQNQPEDVIKPTNMSKKSDDYIPDEELETPYPPTPPGGKENSNNVPSKEKEVEQPNNNTGRPMQGARQGAPFAGMTWTQVENQRHMPFPAGMYGVPPFPYMGHYPNAMPAAAAAAPAAPQKKAPSKTKKGSGDKKEDLRFTEQEKLEFMSIMEQIVPVSQVDWDMVEADFNFNFPERERTVAALRRFFNGCVKKKCPTGDPNIPKWVKMAKQINEAIISKSDAVVEIDDDDMGLEEVAGLIGRRPAEEWVDGARAREATNEAKKDDMDEKEKKPAATVKPVGSAVTNKRKASTKTDETSQILQAILMSDKMNREAAEQRRLDEKAREERQERKDRRREKKSDKRMEMMFGLMAGVMSSYKARGGKGLVVEGSFPFGGDGSSDSDSDSDDSSVLTDSNSACFPNPEKVKYYAKKAENKKKKHKRKILKREILTQLSEESDEEKLSDEEEKHEEEKKVEKRTTRSAKMKK